jgi:hypothetical protein
VANLAALLGPKAPRPNRPMGAARNMHVKLRPGLMIIPTLPWAIQSLGRRTTRLRRSFFDRAWIKRRPAYMRLEI